MIRRLIWTGVAAIAGVALLYISRFWVFQLWGREGLFGIEALRPQGGLLAQWLRGTDFADFELVIWVVLSFLTLTFLQKLYDLTSGSSHE